MRPRRPFFSRGAQSHLTRLPYSALRFSSFVADSVNGFYKKMPDMKHENDPTALTLAPGETKELTWRFDKDVKGQIVLACQMPGHYDGGMVSKIPFVK